MKKYAIALFLLVVLSSCVNREQNTEKVLKDIILMEIISAANNDAYHAQAQHDTLSRLSAMFYAAAVSKTIRADNFIKLFEGKYGYDAMTEIKLPEAYGQLDNMVNIKLDIDQENDHIKVYEYLRRKLPRKNSEELKALVVGSLAESREHLALLNLAAETYGRDGNDLAFADSYSVCRNCGKVFVADSIAGCDVCGHGKMRVLRADDFPVPVFEDDHTADSPEE